MVTRAVHHLLLRHNTELKQVRARVRLANPNPDPNQLASVVVFSERHVLVYPSADAKPPAGEGLNRRCEVTMEGVWPRDRKTGEDLRDARSVREFRAKLQNQADRLGASMLEYDGELGRWRFRVEHF